MRPLPVTLPFRSTLAFALALALFAPAARAQLRSFDHGHECRLGDAKKPEELLDPTPKVIGRVMGTLAASTPTGGSAGAIVRADSAVLDPAWLSAHVRYLAPLSGSNARVLSTSLTGGFVLSRSLRTTFITTEEVLARWEDAHYEYERTKYVGSGCAVRRREWVAAGGVRTWSEFAPKEGAGANEGGTSLLLQGGLQWHNANSFGDHEVIEGFVMIDPATGGLNATVAWHNGVKHGPWIGGMEVGLGRNLGFLVTIDIGYSFEL